MTASLDHVALLVRELEPVLERLPAAIPRGEIETFAGEGTREVYLGDPAGPGKLLLLQAIGPGPYQRAVEKRGPGLHHLGLRAGDLDAFAEGSGWLLHPHSLQSRAHGTLWLARPGVGALLEVVKGKRGKGDAQVSVGVPLERAELSRYLAPGGSAIEGVEAGEGQGWIRVGEETLPLSELLRD